MGEVNQNLWAPWRMEYIKSLCGSASGGCFLCEYWDGPERDPDNHVIVRRETGMILLNRFPYTNGHLLVACRRHVPSLDSLDEPELLDLTLMTRDAIRLLAKVLRPQGFNAGMNFGHCAGAGLPDHLHAHVVPRWSGDTNYMSIIGDVRVVPQSLEDLASDLRRAVAELGLDGPK